MAAVHVDLTIEQGADWPGLAFPIFDTEGAPYDLTGCTARGQIRRVQNSDPALFTWDTSPADGEGLITLANSLLTIRVLGSESSLWDWNTGRYDIYLTNPAAPIGQQTFRTADGAVYLSLGVTR
jgi:hypothetical protein